MDLSFSPVSLSQFSLQIKIYKARALWKADPTVAMELSTIIRLNNNAVAMLSQGDVHIACATLQRALRAVRKTLDMPDHVRSAVPGCFTKRTTLASVVSLPEASCLPAVSNETVFTVYNRAILLNDSMGSSQLTEKQWHVISSAILYNLGLSQHKAWEQDGLSKRLTKALTFYQNAMSLVAPAGNQDELEPDDTVLLLATSNNCAYIHASQLFNAPESRRHVEVMKFLLHSGDMSEMEDDDFDNFLMTISLCEVDEKPAAGAA
jgi:hypothetical protein